MLHRKGQKENWTDLSLLGQEPTFKASRKTKLIWKSYLKSLTTKSFLILEFEI